MAVNTTTINGYVHQADGSVREKSYVIFEQTGFDTDDASSAVVVSTPIRTPIGATGLISQALWPNGDGVRVTRYRVTFELYNGTSARLVNGGVIEVPATGGPYALNDLLPVDPDTEVSPTIQELLDLKADKSDIDDLEDQISQIAVSNGKGPFATVADGLADTVNGDVFTAYDGDRFVGYQNVSGAAVELSSFASLADVVPYSSRAEAQSSFVPADINRISYISNNISLSFIRDSSGTALTTPGGGNWSPDGVPYIDHYGENISPGVTDMSSALTNAFSENNLVKGLGVYRLDSVVDGTNKEVEINGVLTGAAVSGDSFLVSRDDGVYHGPHKVFNFLAKQSSVETREATHSRTRTSQSYILETVGSGMNGPSNADIPLAVEVSKKDYLTSDVEGEIDAAYFIVRQGEASDAGGLLTDARKVKGGYGGLTGHETLAAWVDSTGAVIDHVQTINGFAEGVGGFTDNSVSGFVAESRAGTVHSGFASIGRSDLGVGFQWHYYAAPSRTPSDRWFGVSGDTGYVHIGPSATEMTIRGVGTNLDFHRADGALCARIRSGGVVEAASGVMVSSDSDVLNKVFTTTLLHDFPSVGAHSNAGITTTVAGAGVGDMVMVSPTNDYANGHLIFTGRVTGANTVSVQIHNTRAAAVDPGPQTLKIMVVRFG